ncbi:MAG: hypothetical protein JNM76_15260 [Betaproteobacteria bacterium]|nr:hypothetical protein [Betaproteobacteria bacterium]
MPPPFIRRAVQDESSPGGRPTASTQGFGPKSVLEKMTDADFRKWTRWTVWSSGVFYLASAGWMF